MLHTSIDGVVTLLANAGLSAKPLWLTEFGWFTGSIGVTEGEQADWLVDSLREIRARGDVSSVFIYNFRDRGTDAANPEENFGLVRRPFVDGGYEPKPAYDAVKAYLASVSSS